MSGKHNSAHAGTLIDTLVAGGVAEAVVSPGSRSTPLVMALAARTTAIRVHVVLDERAAGFVALGLARASGRPAALVCTSGSAGAHYLPAIIEASESRVPLLVLTADRPPELHGCGAGQTIDQQRLFGGHVRWFVDVGPPRPDAAPLWLRALAAQAVDRATRSPAGPVHLNVPYRKPLWEPGPPAPAVAPARIVRLDRAAGDLGPLPAALAGRGVIVCGPLPGPVSRERATAVGEAVATLGARLGWPVIAEPTSNARFGHAGAISTADAFLRDPRVGQRLAPEVVLRVGQAPTSKAVSRWVAQRADRVVLLDPDAVWHDPDHTATLLVAADVTEVAERVAPRAHPPSWLAQWSAVDRAAQKAMAQRTDPEAPLWEGAVARAAVCALPEGGALHVASSMPIRDLDLAGGALSRRVRVLCSRGANGIDGTIATAAGEAMAWPRGPLLALVGDLALRHDLPGLSAAVALGVRLTVVVTDNGGGGIFDLLPIAEAAPERVAKYFTTPQGASLADLVRATGARFTEATTPGAALRRAIAAELEHDGVGVVCARVDRAASHRARADAVSASANAALAALTNGPPNHPITGTHEEQT